MDIRETVTTVSDENLAAVTAASLLVAFPDIFFEGKERGDGKYEILATPSNGKRMTNTTVSNIYVAVRSISAAFSVIKNDKNLLSFFLEEK